ncbi:MAG: Asp-tRNA(Asn)/Glu-tRNA(Gln) amidotransferase subunit GatC [Candidatus Sericytochromatia bacterium]
MITKEEVLKIAKLSKLTLKDEEIDIFSEQLNSILGYVEQLNELDTNGIEPSSSAIISSNVFREDIKKDGLDRELALSNAPQKENNMFKVPKI